MESVILPAAADAARAAINAAGVKSSVLLESMAPILARNDSNDPNDPNDPNDSNEYYPWMRRLAVLFVVALTAFARALAQSQSPVDERPLVLLVSSDGWRWDYHTKAPTPNMHRLIARGVRAEGLIPSFPSKTFPNYYTIATGLYPGHHGVVANTVRDPVTGRLLRMSDRREVQNPMWWGGEPIWNTAQRAGLAAATMFWPGSEAPIGGMRPKFWREFDERVQSSQRVDQVLAWLDLPPAERPSLITLYLNETDTVGHWYGPDSTQLRDAIQRTDRQFGRLLDGLESRGLLGRANIVMVSDHGMASTNIRRTIFIDDYVKLSDVDIVDINPTLSIIPAAGKRDEVYRALTHSHPRLSMYWREQTPEHWHLRDQLRVSPIIGVADEGWVVIRRSEYSDYWKRSPDGGEHGYDPRVESMRGLFVAAGPRFKVGVTVPAFENVHVYNVLAMVLGITPASNDGDPAVAASFLR
jgi:predicted AlkP superfamily pyrophosphatase or phosphodiesterase